MIRFALEVVPETHAPETQINLQTGKPLIDISNAPSGMVVLQEQKNIAAHRGIGCDPCCGVAVNAPQQVY